jgi:hypothetical protein
MSRGNAVGTVTGYGLDAEEREVDSRQKQEIFLCGSLSLLSSSNGGGGTSPGVKQPEIQ